MSEATNPRALSGRLGFLEPDLALRMFPSSAESTPAGASGGMQDTFPESCCRICLLTEAEADQLGALFAPCRCTGTMRFVHEHCLERWRAMATNRHSYYRCDACLYEYRIGRYWFGPVLLSPIFSYVVSGVSFLSAAASLGALCQGFVRAFRVAREIGNHSGSEWMDGHAYKLCWRAIMLWRGDYSHKAKTEAHVRLHRYKTVMVIPVQVVGTGAMVLSGAGFALLSHRRARLLRSWDVVRLLVWVAALGFDSLKHDALLMGFALVLSELYTLVRTTSKVMAVRLGERVLEAIPA